MAVVVRLPGFSVGDVDRDIMERSVAVGGKDVSTVFFLYL